MASAARGPGLAILAALVASLPVYGDSWHLGLHVLGAIIFLGNIVVTAAWVALAERSDDASAVRFATGAMQRTDAYFTAPGVILVLGNGLALAASQWGGWSGFWEVSWLVAALALFAASGILWAALLIPLQRTMARQAATNGSSIATDLHRWYLWGAVAIALPLASLYLMVVKPTLW